MAKAALEMAVLDAELRAAGESLGQRLGATATWVPSGVSVGIHPSIPELVDAVDGYVAEGYRRIKLKIEPGFDIEAVRAVREHIGPDVPLQVDANTAYTVDDADHLAALDEFDLLLIEQPLPEDDIAGHVELATRVRTPDLPRREHPVGGRRRRRRRPRRLLGGQHQGRTSGRLPRSGAGPRRLPGSGTCRSGAAAWSRPAWAGPPTWHWRRYPASRFPATPRAPTASSRPTSPSRSSCGTGASTSPPHPASAPSPSPTASRQFTVHTEWLRPA